MSHTVSTEMARFVAGLRFEDIPERVIGAAAQQIMDTLGVAFAAARTRAAPAARLMARQHPRREGAPVVGDDGGVEVPVALLANGVLAHALDFDNTHTGSMAHVGAAVGPTAWTLGAALHAPGSEVLRAYIAGVECVARLGQAVPGAFHRHGFHATPVLGVFGAVLAGAVLSQATPEVIVNALGIAGSAAAGLLEYHTAGTANKQLHPGLAANQAFLALQLATAGADGPDTVFEGPFGLFATHVGEIPAKIETATLGKTWETLEVTTKPYPACNLVHFAIDCLGQLRDQLDVTQVRSVRIRGPKEIVPLVVEPLAAKLSPRNAYEAKFSMHYCAARFLLDGVLGVDSFGAEAVSDPRALALAGQVVFEPQDDPGYPADLGGSVCVTLADGRELSASVQTSQGSPAWPLTPAAMAAKFKANMAPATGYTHAEETAAQLAALADAEDCSAPVSRCGQPARSHGGPG